MGIVVNITNIEDSCEQKMGEIVEAIDKLGFNSGSNFKAA